MCSELSSLQLWIHCSQRCLFVTTSHKPPAAACCILSVDCIHIGPVILVKISTSLFYLQEQKGGEVNFDSNQVGL